MERITVNLTGTTRRATLHGREFIVANGTFIVPGVLPGSDGPLFYPPDEVALDPTPWNGMPIVGYHPIVNGVHMSARHPDILEKQGLGWVFEAKTGQALGGELWFDVQNVTRFDKTLPAQYKLLPRLERGEPIELSTGLRVTKTPAPAGATHNGKAYTHIARGYSPDHVAILPDQQGACSIADKCGVNVTVNEGTPMDTTKRTLLQRIGEMLGFVGVVNCGGKGGKPGPCPGTKRGGKGASKTKKRYGDVEVTSDEDAGTMTLKGKTKASRASLSLDDLGKPAKKPRKRKVRNAANLLDTAPMTKPEAIDVLVANCSCWQGEKDRDTLNGLPDDKVIALAEEAEDAAEDAAVANAAREGFVAAEPGAYVFNAAAGGFVANDESDEDDDPEDEDDDDEDDEPPPKKKPTRNQAVTTPAVTQPKPKTAAEWFAEAPPEVQSAVRNAIDIEAREKVAIVDRMITNVADGEGKTALRTRLLSKDIGELRDLLQIAPPPAEPVNPFAAPIANYAGANGGTQTTQAKDDSDNVLPIITANWDEMASPKLRRKQA